MEKKSGINNYIYIGKNGFDGFVHDMCYELNVINLDGGYVEIYPNPTYGTMFYRYAVETFNKNWIKYKRIFDDNDPYGEETWEE